VLGHNPNARIIAAAYAADLASKFNRDVQRIIETPQYRHLFPDTQLSNTQNRSRSDIAYLRNSDLFEVVDHKGSYRGAGVGQGITGMPCDYGFIDDPIKGAEEAYSPKVRDTVWDWYNKEFLTRMASDGSICLTMTRWHRDDLAGRILRNATKDTEPWIVLSFPAVATEEPAPYDHRQPGEALAPSRYGADWLAKRKAELPRNDWAALYEQNPKPEGGTEWPADYFGPEAWFEEWPKQWAVKIISLDPSKGKKETKTGDYSAFIRLMIDLDGIVWVEADLDRIDLRKLAEHAVEHQRQFRADSIAVESLQFQELLEPEFVRVGKDAGVHMPIQPVTDQTSKVVRIRRIGAFLARGEIRFKNNSPGTRLLVEQLMDFPNADHDDGPDALDMALQEGFRMMAGETFAEEHVY
jgi:predicted phage terminase large subunit-like protein